MEKKIDGISHFSMEEAAKLANSTAAKELFSYLNHTHSSQLQSAMDQAAAGNYSQVKQTLEAMMASEQAKQLFKRLTEASHGRDGE